MQPELAVDGLHAYALLRRCEPGAPWRRVALHRTLFRRDEGVLGRIVLPVRSPVHGLGRATPVRRERREPAPNRSVLTVGDGRHALQSVFHKN